MEWKYFFLVIVILAIMQGLVQPFFNTIYYGQGFREGARNTRNVMAEHFPICVPKIIEK